LPFISHGGSSILVNALAMGVVLSISRDMTGEGDWSDLDLESDTESADFVHPADQGAEVSGTSTRKEVTYA
jgi:hypothetical protein